LPRFLFSLAMRLVHFAGHKIMALRSAEDSIGKNSLCQWFEIL